MEEEQELSKRDRKRLNKEKKVETEEKSSMQNKLLVVGAIVAIAVGAFWFMYRGGDSGSQVETPEVLAPTEVSAEDHVKGPEDAVVTLVEYADFQCPACAAYQPIVNQLAEAFPEDLKIVSRHFPLRAIHRHAQIASQAAEAAGAQGMFWEMADLLYEKQSEWANVRDPRSLFVEYADELALNTEEFETYMNSDEAKNRVNADYDGGFAAGINSTPTFYLNGEKITNPQGVEPFKALIQQAITENTESSEGAEESTDSGEATEEGDITPTL